MAQRGSVMFEDIPSAEQLARRKLFTAALRSDEFQQGKGNLSYRTIVNKRWEHCCLGVACIIAQRNGLDLPFQDSGEERWYSVTGDPDVTDFDNSTVLPATVAKWYGWDTDPEIPYADEDGFDWEIPAADVNDSKGKSFAEIADAFDAKYVAPYEPVEQP